MTYVIEFRTTQIDISKEPENPINPIKGHSLGSWLSPLLNEKGVTTSAVEPEDWGWYLDASVANRSYMIGFIAFEEDDACAIQIEKHRSFTEKILGREKMSSNDPLAGIVEAIIRNSGIAENVHIH